MTTALVIVDHRTASRTARLAHALAGAVDRIVVVANSAAEGVPGPPASALPHGTIVVEPPRNLGYGGGANAGARAVPDAEVLVVANPDVEVDAAAVARLVEAVGTDGVVAAAPRFADADGALIRSAHDREPFVVSTIYELSPAVGWLLARLRPGWHPTLLAADVHDHELDCAHVLGAFVAFDGAAFRRAGGFDERFFLYREETDLCRRMRGQGGRVRHLGTATATHEGDASTAAGGPLFARPTMLASHHRYIALHRSRPVAWLARVLGLLASASWSVTGPDRRAGRRALRWHLGRHR